MSDEDDKKKLFESLNDMREVWREASDKYDKECDAYWDSLTYDQRVMAFYSVCKRISEGDVKQGGSYRYVLYDVFDFGPDVYGVGMECGYMDIHNLIHEGKNKDG